jgi:hypothetical protein
MTVYHRDLPAIQEHLAQLGPLRLRIVEYRLTHGYLHLELHAEDYSKRADIYLNNCLFICGPPAGGPWQLTAVGTYEDAQKVIVLSAAPNFLVKALRMDLSLSPP